MSSTRLFPLAFVALSLLASCTKLDSAASSPEPTKEGSSSGSFVVVTLAPAADGDVRAVLKAETQKAKEKGLKPYVELWATWCGPCKALEASMKDSRMQTAYKGTYVVRLDIDAWGAKLDGTGLSSSAIPVFYALDEEGKPTGRKVDGGAWGDDVAENMAPVLDKFFHGS